MKRGILKIKSESDFRTFKQLVLSSMTKPMVNETNTPPIIPNSVPNTES